MSFGVLSVVSKVIGNSVITPCGVMRAIAGRKRVDSTNHRFPSGPVTMPRGSLSARGMVNSVSDPDGVSRPTRFAQNSVNHRLPSGPAVMLSGPVPKPWLAGTEPALSLVISPAGVTRRMKSGLPPPPLLAFTYMFPSGPAAIVCAPPTSSTSTLNCLICPLGETRPTTLRKLSAYHTLPSPPRAMLPM